MEHHDEHTQRGNGFVYLLTSKAIEHTQPGNKVAIRNVNLVIKLIFKRVFDTIFFFNFLKAEVTDFYILISAKINLATI